MWVLDPLKSSLLGSAMHGQCSVCCSALVECVHQDPLPFSTHLWQLIPWLPSPWALIPPPPMPSHQRCCCALPPAISCPVLEPPSRGRLNCSHPHGNFTYNSTCTFSCEDGFVRMGAGLLRCQAMGNWTSRSPVCKGTVGLRSPVSCVTS